VSPVAGQTAVKVLSFCPGWVLTNMIPDHRVIEAIFKVFAFNTAEGLAGLKMALFAEDLKGGEFIGNARLFLFSFLPRQVLDTVMDLSTKFSIREAVVSSLAIILLGTQRLLAGPHVALSSKESLDEAEAAKLYDWTRKELEMKGYL
jgi:hypothetical protein